MITRIVLAVLIAVLVGIGLMAFLGPALITLNVPIAEVIGRAFREYGWTLGVVAGLWYFLRGGGFRPT
jgi:hypothetical protein